MSKRTLVCTFPLILLLVIGAFAQDQKPTAGKKLTDMQVTAAPLPPKASALSKRAAHPGGGGGGMSWTTHRWEVSIQAGAAIGGNLGRPNVDPCVGATVAVGKGCDTNQALGHDLGDIENIGVYPGHFSGIRDFLGFGGVKPGTGTMGGVRLGVNIAPTWQVEFIWNHAQSDTAFSNEQILNDQVAAFVNAGFGGGQRLVQFRNNFDGHAHGTQNMYLFNLNKQFNVGSRVQPYIGFGVGAETWYANPKADVIVNSRNSGSVPRQMEVSKVTDSATGFAFDFAGGVKFYVTDHFGFRTDFMDVMSFPGLTLASQTLDSSNQRGFGVNAVMPISGTIKQSGHFNQALITGGVFWQFGGALTPPSGGPSGDRDSMNDHWEVSLNFGGVHGIRMGDHGSTCTSTLATGCAVIQTGLGHDQNPGVGVYPSHLTTDLPAFQATGGITAGDGWVGGASLGFNLNPRWQVEFIWNILGTGTKFDNYSLLVNTVEGYWGANAQSCGTVTCHVKTFDFAPGQDGTARGNQQQYLFNLNYNFVPNHRLVPYVGIGFGAEHWYNSPKVSITTINTRAQNVPCVTGAFTNNCRVAMFTKNTDAQTGFAFDVAAGVKYYISRHWGLRADFMNVFSFQDFHSTFQSIDVSGLRGTVGALVPLSGTLAHTGHFSQAQGSGGFFFTF